MITYNIELPDDISAELENLPETGMDFQLVDVLLIDGRVLQTVVLGCKLLVTDELFQPDQIRQILCVRGRDGTIYNNPTV